MLTLLDSPTQDPKHYLHFPTILLTLPSELKVMNGRHFSGMVVEAYIADGNEKFKKSSEKKAAAVEEEEDGEEEGKRLDQFGSWLEEEAGAAKE